MDDLIKKANKSTLLKMMEHRDQCLREEQNEERNNRILDLYLKCWTQEAIAEEVSVDQKTVGNILGKFATDSEIPKDFEPSLYDVWNYEGY